MFYVVYGIVKSLLAIGFPHKKARSFISTGLFPFRSIRLRRTTLDYTSVCELDTTSPCD